MRLHGPSPPQGKNSRSLLFSLLPPHIQYSPPQGIADGVPAFLGDIMAYEPDNWLNAQWQKRVSKIINAGQVPSTQTDFPLLINDIFPELIGKSEAELRFASTDDIQLKYEIEKFDTVTGELIAWIKKPTVSDGDIIYIYFDNPLATDEQDPTAVWSNNFVVVQHMNETSGNILDSSPFGNDMTTVGTPINAAGVIGNAKEYPSSNDGYTIPANDSLNTTDITVSMWIKATSYSGPMIIASKASSPTDVDWFVTVIVGTLTMIISNNPDIPTGFSPLPNVDYHVVFVITGTTTLNVYVDKVLVHTQTITAKQASSISSLEISASGGNTGFDDGIIDEFHMSNDAKSADWLATEFNNQTPTGNTFYSTGAEESVPTIFDSMAYEPDNWLNPQLQQRLKLVINAGQVPSPLTDFPLLINDIFPDLVGHSEEQLRFASTDNIQLKYEIEKFNDITGELIAWIKKPTVSDGDILYIYFDNAFPTVDEQDSPAVWSNNFAAVYHMNQFSGNILDSSPFGNDMTPNGTPVPTPSGPINSSKEFLTDDEGYSVPHNDSLDIVDLTVSVWVRATVPISGTTQNIVSKAFNPLSFNWSLLINPAGILHVLIENNGTILLPLTLSPSVLYHMAFTISGTNFNAYVDGDLIHTQTITPRPTGTTSDLDIAGASSTSGLDGGLIDEVKISNDAKSSDWIKTEYNNQRPTGNTFYSAPIREFVPTTFNRMAYEVVP